MLEKFFQYSCKQTLRTVLYSSYTTLSIRVELRTIHLRVNLLQCISFLKVRKIPRILVYAHKFLK